MSQVKKSFSYFFNHLPQALKLRDERIYILRRDGIIIHQTKESSDQEAVGALMVGAWESTNALKQGLSDSLEARLNLEFSSSSGISIHSFFFGEEDYLLGCIYQDQLNPGKLKMNLKQLAVSLSSQVLESKKGKSKEKLFENITDQEIDKIFSGIGG